MKRKSKSAEDEYLDLVDSENNVVGKRRRSEIYALGLRNFRVINAFIVNTSGKLWIPRRTADKRVFPLCLDVSMGGHVKSGETYRDAFVREISEELNINIYEYDYRFMGKLTPEKDDVSAFMEVYEIATDVEPLYNKEDFVESFWLYPREVLERIDNGDIAKEDLPKLIRHFYCK
jgi:isopentenyl-diphosphate delta-isomerase